MAATSDCCFYALEAHVHSLALRPFVWACESPEDGVCSQPVLRGLFAADQDLLLKAAPINRREWHGLKQHTRRQRCASPAELQGQWQQAPQHEQKQEGQAMQSAQQEQLLQLRLAQSAKQRLPSHQELVPPVVTLRQPSSSTADTASTCCSGGCSCSGAECSSEPYGGEPGTESGSAGSFSQECRQQQQQHSRSDVCYARSAGSGQLENSPDDVSAQKAAAQAQYALQQQQQQQHGSQKGASLTDAMLFSPDLLFQEESRLLQQDLVTRAFWLLLSCNLLFGLMVLAAKGPLAKLVAGNPAQWPLLLCLSGCLAWMFMAKWRPLHFADTALEQQYAARYQAGRYLLDVWFNLAGCAGIVAAVRGDGAPAKHLAFMHMPLQHVAGLPAVPLHKLLPAVFLGATLLAAILLLLSAPNVYRRWREQLLFVGKVAMVCSLVAVQTTQDSSSVQGLDHQPQQQPWLALVGYQRPHMQVASVLLAMGAVQAFLLLTLMVRVSAYVPMQLLHMTVLLVTVANSGSSGLGMALYALQLLSCGLWLPACVLLHLEVSARRAFLQCQQSLACCSASSLDKLRSAQCPTTCHK